MWLLEKPWLWWSRPCQQSNVSPFLICCLGMSEFSFQGPSVFNFMAAVILEPKKINLGWSKSSLRFFQNIVWKTWTTFLANPVHERSCHLWRETVFLLLSNLSAFYSFSVLNWGGESGLLCFVPDHRRKVSCLSSLSIILSAGFLIDVFYQTENVPF